MRTGFANIVCCSSSSENDAVYDVPSYANVLWTANLLNVSSNSTFYMHEEKFLLFSFAHFIARELQSGYSIISFGCVCALILGNAVRIFCAIDAKYVIFVSVYTNF